MREPRIRRKKDIKVRVLDMLRGRSGAAKRTDMAEEANVKEVRERSPAGGEGRRPMEEDLQCQASSLCLQATDS